MSLCGWEQCGWCKKRSTTCLPSDTGTRHQRFCWKPETFPASISSFEKKTTLNNLFLEVLIALLCWCARQEHSTPERAWGGGSCGWEWSHTHLSPSSQSDPESADWKHTCKSDRARMLCVLQFICIITVLRVGKLERKSHTSAGPAGLKPDLSLGICLSGALLWASSNQNQQRTSPRAQ